MGTDSVVRPQSRELLLEEERNVGADGAGSRCADSKSPTLEEMEPG